MFACVDVDYRDSFAIAACITFRSWDDGEAASEHVTRIEGVAPYVPGQFYRRELPCILEVIRPLTTTSLDGIVIDGYVWLGDEESPGLGAYLFDSLDRSTPIIGVAKNPFAGATLAKEVVRGTSQRRLYITTAGVDSEVAAGCIRSMHGNYRIPTLLKRVDLLAREASTF